MEEKKKKYFAPGNHKPRRPKPAPGDMIYGIQPLLEALEAGKEIEKILLQRDSTNPQLLEIAKRAKELGVPVAKVPDMKLNRVTGKNHQGVIAFMSAVTYASLDNIITEVYAQGQMPFILLLDRVTDVRNFGAIARTAECAGVHAIVIPDRESAQINSDAVRTSAGALAHIPVCRTPDLPDALTYLKENGLQAVACSEKGDGNIYQVDFLAPTVVVMGSEEDGISPGLMEQCDHLAQIPMYGKVGSLNVSVATGIILFEATRQKHLNA